MKIKNYQLFLESVDSIKSICERYGIKNYTINEDGSVDVDGEVYICNKSLTKLPLKFGKVTGNFVCYNNQLTSLEGVFGRGPEWVGGNFYISKNQLTSLEGSPKEVGGTFYCQNNQLTSLEGGPKSVGRDFYCYGNKLTTLEGSPESVGGTFYCHENQLTSLVGGPEVVLGDYYAFSNKITSFEGFPDDYENGFDFTNNPVQRILNQFPEELWTKAIYLINDYDAIWNGEVVPERLEMVKEKLGLNDEN
jgi:hypothetical protein